jgi:long-chain fatty acid transport protein
MFMRKSIPAIVLLACLGGSAMAQTNTENFAQFTFNFNNPGARASGIGGAFISIADDATASEANPAGLTVLIRPEFSVEVKGIRFKNLVNNFDHTTTPTANLVNNKTFENSVFSPSFASFVYPTRRLTFAAFRYELVHFKSDFYTRGAYAIPFTDGTYFFPVSSTMDMNITNYGAAVAYKFNEMFSIGVSGGLSLIDVTSSLKRYALELFTPSTLLNEASIDATDNSPFFNVGVIFRPTSALSFGAIFKKRPSFSLDHRFQYIAFPQDSVTMKKINFNVPTSYGFGISYRPSDVFTLSFDAVRIMNSDLTKDFTITIEDSIVFPKDFAADDGFELHFGAEYVALFRHFGMVFRAGVYSEPDNRIHWAGGTPDLSPTNPNLANERDRQLSADLFRAGESVLHYTFGVGVIASNNFQVDVAGHLSDRADEVIASFVWRL